MRKLEMKYYNVYYYCNILDNILCYFMSGPDWAPTGAQFTEPFFEGEIDNFPKYSALHAFCDFAVRQLMFEEAEEQLDEVQIKYDELEIDNRAKRLKMAFEQAGNGSLFLEVDRLFKMYEIKHETFFSYLVNNDFEFILDAYSDFTEFDGDLDDAIEHLTRELFYVLFQNRDFLFRFNSYMANANDSAQKRCVIPQWVKRAVRYRDRGKCVCCGKDLSGLLDCEDNGGQKFCVTAEISALPFTVALPNPFSSGALPDFPCVSILMSPGAAFDDLIISQAPISETLSVVFMWSNEKPPQ